MSFQDHLAVAKSAMRFHFEWKTEQSKALESIYNGKDTLCLLPTGYGKSAIFQTSPFLIGQKLGSDKTITLVISPLNSIMEDQVRKMSQKGIKACALNMEGRNGETFKFRTETGKYI